MVISGLGYWLRNRYLFCLNQVYHCCYSYKIIDASGTTHIYAVKAKLYYSKWIFSQLSKGGLCFPQQKTVCEETSMLLCTLKNRIWEADGTHVKGRQTPGTMLWMMDFAKHGRYKV